jgi:TonB family protein
MKTGRHGIALAVALMLHVAILSALVSLRTEPAEPAPPKSILSIELRERPQRTARPPVPGKDLVRAPNNKKVRPNPREVVEVVPPRSGPSRPLAVPPPGAAPAPGPVDLFHLALKDPGLATVDAGVVDEKRLVEGRLRQIIGEQQDEAVAEAPTVDPYLSGLERSTKDGWHPTPGDVGGSDGPAGQVANLLSGWHSVGKQWARSGSPYADPAAAQVAPVTPLTRTKNASSGFDPARFAAQWNAGDFAFGGSSVVLELAQAEDGHPLRVRVLQSSGFSDLDESARTAVLEAAGLAPLPPKELLSLPDRKLETLWALDARLVPNTCSLIPDLGGESAGQGVTLKQSRNPGNTTGFMQGLACGGTFDLSTGKVEGQPFLTTHVVTKVVLVAVRGQHP